MLAARVLLAIAALLLVVYAATAPRLYCRTLPSDNGTVAGIACVMQGWVAHHLNPQP